VSIDGTFLRVRSREGETMKLGLLPLIVCVALQASGVGAAMAVDSHAFDPVLSLTGGCSVSELDPVPDPGLCPMPPGVPGVDHPTLPFLRPGAVATDSYGDIFVSNIEGTRGVIDVFNASGEFLSELEDPDGPQALAVDGSGNLYVGHIAEKDPEFGVVLYRPTVYKPAEGLIEYGQPSKGIVGEGGEEGAPFYGLAVNPLDDQLFVKTANNVMRFKSASEENEFVEQFETGLGTIAGESKGIAIDAAHDRLVVGTNRTPECVCIRVLKLTAPHELVFTIEESAVPEGKFLAAQLSLAVDEATGHIFAYDDIAKKVYEFDDTGKYLTTIDRGFQKVFGAQIGVDNGAHSPNGAQNPLGRYLYVPSNPSGTGHIFAFGPSNTGSPKIESLSFTNVGEREAELQAEVEPFGLPTHYRFEYVSQRQFEEAGDNFVGAQVAGEGDIPGGHSPVAVAAGAVGLQPGVAYRFRVTAINVVGGGQSEGTFATYPQAASTSACPNEAVRAGVSGLLPDCRAYELVTPPSTNARAPIGVNGFLGMFFPSREASPAGNEISFEIFGGSLLGVNAVGSLAGDPYSARRQVGGWTTSYVGPNGFETPSVLPGSHSPDQGYSFWQSDDATGSAQIDGERTTYLRYPDGHTELVGRGSIADDPHVVGHLIAEAGSHVIFSSTNFKNGSFDHPAVQLEPDAPPDGTAAIYDRTPDEVTHVVSLLPGNGTPEPGDDALFEGASLDGRGIAFRVKGALFLRYNDEETYEVGGKGVTFAGVAENGNRIFYLEGGDLFRYDVVSGTRVAFTGIGNVTPVNVSADGTVAYFISPDALQNTINPRGAAPVDGAENLYRSEEGNVAFVGTVTERDVVGGLENVPAGGLGLWIRAQQTGGLARDPSRTTADGKVLLFESRAPLAGYDSGGNAEIYRYDSAGDTLECLSCSPTQAPASGDASLQSIAQGLAGLGAKEPLSVFSFTSNLAPDGRRAFFQSSDALVPGDTDGLQDVYEWEAQGLGGCSRATGCVSLISSGHSARIDYLFAVSASGDDVFFRTSDLLLLSDLEETPSIYDAKVGGGFAEETPAASASAPSSTPNIPVPGMQPSRKTGNVKSHRRCRNGQRHVRRHGKARCVRKRHRRHHAKPGGGNNGGHK
jgi:hypothetical protein